MLITRRKFHDRQSFLDYLHHVDVKYEEGKSILNATNLLNGLSVDDIDFDNIFELFDLIPKKDLINANLEILTDEDDYIERVYCNSFDRNSKQPSRFTIRKAICSQSLEIPYIEGVSYGEGEFEFDKDKCKKGIIPVVPLYFLREFEMLSLVEGEYIHKRYHYDVFVYIPREFSLNF